LPPEKGTIGPEGRSEGITVSLGDRRENGLVTAVLWEEWAEMSISHRDVHDADVAAVLRLVRKEAELDQLRRDGRPFGGPNRG